MSELDGTELIDWRQLPPSQRRGWWEQLWHRAIAMADRYHLALRSGWWADALQVEALAAFAGWLRLYDTGAYTDPPGKLQLLWELERLRAVLHAGDQAFDPDRDRPAFSQYLDTIEHPTRRHTADHHAPHHASARAGARQLAQELAAVTDRLAELRHRQTVLAVDRERARRRRGSSSSQVEHEQTELDAAISQLICRERELRRDLGGRPCD